VKEMKLRKAQILKEIQMKSKRCQFLEKENAEIMEAGDVRVLMGREKAIVLMFCDRLVIKDTRFGSRKGIPVTRCNASKT